MIESFFAKSFQVCEISLDLRTEKNHNVTLNTILWIKKEFIPLVIGQAEGKADMKNLLGGKGANLAEMNLIGIPVLASDIDVLHEVAGNAAYFINPYSIEDIRHGVIELLDNNKLRASLISNGRKNIMRFSPQNIARQYKSLYNQL